MFLRKMIEKLRRDELAELRSEVEALRNEVRAEKAARETYVNEDGERVPMSKVISEYLYGKEEKE